MHSLLQELFFLKWKRKTSARTKLCIRRKTIGFVIEAMMKKIPQQLVIKYESLYSFWTQSFCGVREKQMDGGRRRHTAILISSSRDHNGLCYLQSPLNNFFVAFGSSGTQPGVYLWDDASVTHTATRWPSPWLIKYLLDTSWNWLHKLNFM